MAERARESIRPNIIAALPGRMVDEAPKKGGRDAGAREQKLIPTIMGLLGAIVVMVLLIMVDAVSIVLDTEGLMFQLAVIGLTVPLFVGMVAGFGGYTFLNLRTRSYTLYEDKVEMKEGFLKEEAKTLPYNRITNVKFRQNVWERMFDAGTVQLQTAGSDKAELWLRGIDNPENIANRIREMVGASEMKGGEGSGH